MRILGVIMLLFSLLVAPTLADDQVVTYVKHNGNFIELTDSWFPGKTSIKGAQRTDGH